MRRTMSALDGLRKAAVVAEGLKLAVAVGAVACPVLALVAASAGRPWLAALELALGVSAIVGTIRMVGHGDY